MKRRNRLWKKSGAAALILVLAGSLLAGCGSDKANQAGSGADSGSGSANQPLKIKMTLNFDGKEVPQKDNEVERAMEQYTNTELDLTHISSNDFCTKLPVMIASGELPQVLASCGAPNQSYLITAAKNGAFWDITDLIKDYKNLASMPQLVYDNVSIEGRVYGIPRFRPVSRYTSVYRQDWLDHLGMQPPQTLDDLYQMLKAFTEQDPDKNGKNDTVGVTIMISNNNISFDLSSAFGAPNNWSETDGKFVKAEETPEYLEYLKFMKKLYDEGLMNKDFASIDVGQNEGNLENGKAGVINATTNNVLGFQTRVEKVNPAAKLDFVSALEGPQGRRVAADRGSNGILMFPKSSVKSEAELKQLLAFFDKLADKEMADLLEWGIAGKHYEIKDGKAVRLNQELYDNEVSFPYNKPLVTVPLTAIKTPGDLDPISEKVLQVEKENEQFAVKDPTMSLVSDTWAERGAELTQILIDAKVKFIMGKLDENGWKQQLEKFKQAGGDKVAEEYAAALAKSK
ncbi:extracellular solute-binding protein [Paenibacillus macerans]|nr:extracellular solute-binding protein [Paenibacillus macerans]KFN10414.1 bacterial extracellular solute-binding family protein [Paenibacillus macerans]MBS5910370.1 extracellular solute-binding protein [Paenibacillus macerans]MCY7557086.1 extracellular solute-binding protein [Paenibacillus macerans]MEC0139407.1 extracellular solute-binding protein [Paenibacillus macerans]MEC0151621.1 extracellular solute-binding protein [Paenibacillus macerans]